MTKELQWRKSSRSSANTNCVEVAQTLDRLRDSKNPGGPVLAFTPDELAVFLEGAKAGRFDN